MPVFLEGDRGTGTQENTGQEGDRTWEKKRQERWELGKNRENLQTCIIFCNRNKTKRWVPLKKRHELGVKGTKN